MSIIKNFVAIVAFIFIALVLIGIGSASSQFQGPSKVGIKESSILSLKLEGVIVDGQTVLEPLREYAHEDSIKGVHLYISSPGGVVGPSQEIFAELVRIKNELKKPVFVSCGAMAASGGYYAAVAANKIYTNPGTLMGSIGVIMEFADLSELYSWAKIKPTSIKSGGLKDAGSSYRPMTSGEREYFQSTIDDVQDQFKSAILSQRKIEEGIFSSNTDGRIFSGKKAVEMGFADHIGTQVDALKELGKLTGLGDRPKLFVPPKKRPGLSEILAEMKMTFGAETPFRNLLQLLGKPIAILPGVHL